MRKKVVKEADVKPDETRRTRKTEMTMGDYGGLWIVLPQKDNELVVDEER